MNLEELYDTKLHEAVRYGDLDEVIEALKEGYSPNQIGLYQWSPLHEACNNGDEDIVKQLLLYEADPNRKDALKCYTALHYAAKQDHAACLRLLLNAGGLIDVKSSDGQCCVDVAQGECRNILQEKRDKEILSSSLTKNTNSTSVEILSSPSISSPRSDLDIDFSRDHARQISERGDSGLGDQNSLFDQDDLSITSISSGTSSTQSRAWYPDQVVGLNKQSVLGHIQLSFEHNAKKSTFKIRIWQVQDLLLPQPETSMIYSIYVKSYLLPDKKKLTKRKTEEIRVDTQKDVNISKKSSDTGHQGLHPSHFKFAKPLEYSGITLAGSVDKTVSLSVCIIQKYTHKSFALATWSMPMERAVRQLLKQKYALSPCISTSIPENMKVYNASELDIVKSRRFSSHPNLGQSKFNFCSWATPYADRSVSESDLTKISVQQISSKVSSIEISIPEERDLELEEALEQISIMEKKAKSEDSNVGSTHQDKSHMSIPLQNSDSEDDDKLEEVEVHKPPKDMHVSVEVHQPIGSRKSKSKPKSQSSSVKQERQQIIDEHVMILPEQYEKDSVIPVDSSHIYLSTPTSSRPESPTWDNYAEPISISMVDLPENNFTDQNDVHLPVAVSLDLPQVHSSFVPKV